MVSDTPVIEFSLIRTYSFWFTTWMIWTPMDIFGIDRWCTSTPLCAKDRLILIGHSAGGCLALWAAHQLATTATRMPVVLAAAPVADLVKAYEMKVSDEGGGKGVWHWFRFEKTRDEDIIQASTNCVNGNEHVKCREFHLPLAILAGHSPWHHGWPEVMRWNSIWSKRRPQKRHWRSIGKLPPQLCFVAYGKKKGSIYQQNDIFVGKPHLKKRPVMVAGYFARSIPCSSIIPETCSTFYCESSLFGGLLSYGSPVRFGIWRINKLQHELFGVNFADSRTPPRVQL